MTDKQLAVMADPGQNLPLTRQYKIQNPSKFRRKRTHQL